MSDAVIVALITGACAIIAQLIISHNASEKLYAELDKRSELSDKEIQGKLDVFETKLTNLTNEVRKHNSIIDRTYKLEESSKILEEKIKVANHRIDDLERQE